MTLVTWKADGFARAGGGGRRKAGRRRRGGGFGRFGGGGRGGRGRSFLPRVLCGCYGMSEYAATIRYALSGTELAYAATIRYALSGTEIWCAVTIRDPISGTEIGYDATSRERRSRGGRRPGVVLPMPMRCPVPT
eukprot:76176-Rhodomonas_salina.1